MIHLLDDSNGAEGRASFLWREQVRSRFRDCLRDPEAGIAGIGLQDWLTRKSRWRELLTEPIASLERMPRAPLSPRILSEKTYTHFRLQRIVLESFPGWKVGLNLFLPLAPGRYRPILCPCGHGPKWLEDHQLPPQILARNGFAAALFDMPMFGELSRNNNHFIQGVQAWTVGLWSNLFFLIDPIRIADYLQTRPDIDASRGFGVTGVSGGGMCALFLPQVDARISVLAPACCLSPFAAYLTDGFYTGCPENYLWRQVAGGMDYHYLAALAAPRPCLVLSGRQDTLYTADSVERVMVDIRHAYSLEGASDRLRHVAEDCPHKYTASMAQHAVGWFDRWLREGPGDLGRPEHDLLKQEELDCGTAASGEGMAAFVRREAERLRTTRMPCADADTLRTVLAIREPSRQDIVETVPPPSNWTVVGLQRRILKRAGDLPLPLLEMENSAAPAGVFVCISDEDKMRSMRSATGFFGIRRHLVAADIRGFGELAPESSDYDLHSWCSIDRSLSHLLYLLGETVVGRQTEDVLRVLAHAIRACPGEELVVYGHGEAALPALFAGILHERVAKIVLDSFPCNFETIVSSPDTRWKHYVFIPNALRFFDIPELILERREKSFLLCNPCGAMRESVDEETARRIFAPDRKHLTLHVVRDGRSVCEVTSEWLNGASKRGAVTEEA